MNTDEFYRTTDICLATVCCYFGCKIELVEKANPARAYFVFIKNEKIEKVIKNYFNHELQVDPAGFFSLLKEVKTRLYNA
jgi:hypothetical protein